MYSAVSSLIRGGEYESVYLAVSRSSEGEPEYVYRDVSLLIRGEPESVYRASCVPAY